MSRSREKGQGTTIPGSSGPGLGARVEEREEGREWEWGGCGRTGERDDDDGEVMMSVGPNGPKLSKQSGFQLSLQVLFCSWLKDQTGTGRVVTYTGNNIMARKRLDSRKPDFQGRSCCILGNNINHEASNWVSTSRPQLSLKLHIIQPPIPSPCAVFILR